jgi:hypothetical protein
LRQRGESGISARDDRIRYARDSAMRALLRPDLESGRVDKERIVAEIRRTAEANGGTPLGRARFSAETGIREHDWRGRFWARWNDALAEAGYRPNELQHRRDEHEVLAKLVDEIRRLGRMPTVSELNLRRRADSTFPSVGVFERFGPKSAWPSRVADYCRPRADHADVLAIVVPLVSEPQPQAEEGADDAGHYGFVYLIRSGRHYKIGHTLDVGRRRYDLAIQLPEPVVEEHVIRTDDPTGIERYWHERFASRRKNGEWFELPEPTSQHSRGAGSCNSAGLMSYSPHSATARGTCPSGAAGLPRPWPQARSA